LGTGTEQTVTIEQSSGLSDAEIDRMRSEAEDHAADDKAKRELVELRNQADQMCFQVEKLMTEHTEKLSDADKAPLEKAIQKVREAAKGDDAQAVKSAVEELEQASHAFSKTLYESQGAAGAEAAGAATGSPNGSAAAESTADDDTIDAEFEVKKD
jgi:molecular chaperone DnaK